jgi:RNA polymerase sigma-70 factor (ECF subfamily)
METPGEITRLLGELKAGNRDVETKLIDAVYPELRRIARRYLSAERSDHILQPTALVNETWLRMTGRLDKDWQNRSQFFAIAAHLIRQILVDYAREKRAFKREGDRRQVEFTECLAISDDRLDQIIDVHEALERLAGWDLRQSKVVELRFFGGLTEIEISEALGVATRTVRRDWNVARAWLHIELNSACRVRSLTVAAE